MSPPASDFSTYTPQVIILHVLTMRHLPHKCNSFPTQITPGTRCSALITSFQAAIPQFPQHDRPVRLPHAAAAGTPPARLAALRTGVSPRSRRSLHATDSAAAAATRSPPLPLPSLPRPRRRHETEQRRRPAATRASAPAPDLDRHHCPPVVDLRT